VARAPCGGERVLKLTDAFERWSPSRADAARTDPLTLLAAGWAEIVGDDIARNSRPVKMFDRAVLVVTRSSAWSQQLSLLSERILTAIHARLPATGIESLRFKVGRIAETTPKAAPAPAQRRAQKASQPHTPAATASQALERFRGAVTARQRAKREAGWNECEGCGALVPPGTKMPCVRCANARRSERELAVARLLFEAPWLGYAGTAALVDGLLQGEYESIRTRVLSRWWRTLGQAKTAKRLSRDGRERLIASSYVLLETRLPPENVFPATVRNVLGDELHELIYGTERQTKTHVQ